MNGPTPLFLCHANCSRSVLAEYLYKDLCHAPATSAGLAIGDHINDKAESMLRYWGIDASHHVPRQLTRDIAEQAPAIFVMGPTYLHRMLMEYGEDLANKSYLFRDPFTVPMSFDNGQYKVIDPSYDQRDVRELVKDHGWIRGQVARIYLSLTNGIPSFVSARWYLDLLKTVDPGGH